ncbi:MAG: ADP-ribosylglycohydrolase family protein [Candidatus Marinimicrobia bacterium]|nr:ADP-ribosylglycohydrolase family protein [Candidatus Neomarinimicrobiota bacterium]
MIVRYLDFVERLEFELIQREDEGNDISPEKLKFQAIQQRTELQFATKNQTEAEQILKQLSSMAVPVELARNEPNNIHEIKKSLVPKEQLPTGAELDQTDLYNAILGGWLGRAGGCLLGKPIERYHRTIIREILESNDAWPLDNYFTQVGMPQELLQKYPWKRRLGFESLRENIQCMPEDDDLNFTMLNLHILETNGPEFTSENVAEAWLKKLPVYEVFTAERVAYNNLLNGISPPDSGEYLNPFREWIGAQIRADLWGYVCPGNPEQAAEFAWRDARMTHTRTGIYGEMFFAAVIAGAFVEYDIRKLIQLGLDQVPSGSRFSRAIKTVLDIPIEASDWEAVVDQLYDLFGHYHWVHTINNAALTVASLIHGAGDYARTITNAVMGGWDTDCNGATAGSIVGILQGAKALPEKWIQPLNNQIRSSLGGFDRSKITDLAQRAVEAVKRVNTESDSSNLTRSDDY